MSSSNERVLVTGGTGFVGSHLVDHLIERGCRVRCLVRRSSNLRYLIHPDIEFVYGGLDSSTDWDKALDGVERVYHVAGLTFARRREDYYTVNHKGTEAILSEVIKRRQGIRRFVYVSSLAAMGPGQDGIPVTEDCPQSPLNAYGQSKMMAEEAVRASSDLVPFTIVRPPAVYGPRDYGIYELFKAINRGLSVMIGREDKRISLVHARDLVEGIVLAGESDKAAGRSYFISSEEVYSWRAVSDKLAEVLGKKPLTITIPLPVAYTIATVAEMGAAIFRRTPVVNRDKIQDLSQPCWACSIDRARNDLGYRQKISLEDGFRETAEWYRKEGWL